jgi:hypothetical protein
MLPDDTRRQIKNITTGALLEGTTDHCTTIRNQLCRRFETSTTVKTDFEGKAVIKKEQEFLIKTYCDEYQFWLTLRPDESHYLTRGGEAKVYLHSDKRNVIKLNDAVYYATWLEFFNSVLLHNLIFENTQYSLVGFLQEGDSLIAVLKQPFIISDEQVEIGDIKKFLEFNGFENTRRHDYVHKQLGLILEDMHDENVIAKSDTLFFIDTVFYTIKAISSE